MKTIKSVAILISVFIFIFGGCAEKTQLPNEPVNPLGKVTITNFTANEFPTRSIDPGTTKIEGQNLIVKEQIMESRYEADNSLVTGIAVITANGKLNSFTGEGPIHGKVILTPDAITGSFWECNWTGYRSKTGELEWTGNLHIVGHGEGGEIDGMKIYIDEEMYTDLNNGENGYWGIASGYMKSK
jgi:hypothetical protein